MNALPSISFGENVHQPNRLETRNTRDVLWGIRDGQWRDKVARVRDLPSDSAEQKAAKLALPYTTWAGVFSHRSNSKLHQHSGQIGIDLDGLGEAGAIAAIQAAVADNSCLAAFRSTRGEGVRLLFRIPPCSPANHSIAFEQVALHVRNTYGHEADTSGRDVSRASFVSFDNGLWFNAKAETLRVVLPDDTQRLGETYTRCVSSALYAGRLADTWPSWYGRTHANTIQCQNGHAKTHSSLLDLGKALALHAERLGGPLTARQTDEAFDAWFRELTRKSVALRLKRDEYRRELLVSVRGCHGKPWFKAAAEKWLRWTNEADFPMDGLAREKILFTIHRHCTDANRSEFFLGARDAGLIAGVSFNTASRVLRKLVLSGCLEKKGVRRGLRHAQTYRLLRTN